MVTITEAGSQLDVTAAQAAALHAAGIIYPCDDADCQAADFYHVSLEHTSDDNDAMWTAIESHIAKLTPQTLAGRLLPTQDGV